MNAIKSGRPMMDGRAVSRRTALRGLRGAGLTALLAVALPARVTAEYLHPTTEMRFAVVSGDDPVAVIGAYIAAANAGNLQQILDLYANDAVHIFLPTPDGSAGVCLGKDQFRMWFEQSLANGDQVELEVGTLAVDGNQATFLVQVSSEPWRTLGVESLEAKTDLVVIDGRIVTHLVTLTPESVRTLQAARESSTDPTIGSASPLLPSERRGAGKPY